MQFSQLQAQKHPEIKLDQFQLTIFAHDYYMIALNNMECYPLQAQKVLLEDLGYKKFKDIKGRPLKIAPVVRLYGTNNYGQKCCVHVHGYYPYFYVKIEDLKHCLTPQFLLDFADKLEKCYILSYGNPALKKSNKHAEQFQSDAAKNSGFRAYIVHSIEIVERYDIYSFHSVPEKFLKINLYDPKYVKPLSKILSHPIVLNRKFQTFESHITYFMHFYADANIYGMSEMTVMNFKFRRNFDEGRMRNFQKIFIEKTFHNTFDYFFEVFDLVDLQETKPDLFSPLSKTSTCYVELDLHFENIVNKIVYELNQVNFFTQQTQQPGTYSSLTKTDGVFQPKVTKPLRNMWNDEEERRKEMGITEPTAFYIDYSNNVEENPKFMKLICGAKKSMFPDILPCNFIWDEANLEKLTSHLKDYYTSIEKEDGTGKEQITNVNFNEQQLANFPSLLQYEKNEMISMMSSRFAEWGRRGKENMKNKPGVYKSVEDELAMYYQNYEGEEEYDVREDLKNIEGSTVKVIGGIARTNAPKKPVKLNKTATVPNIGFCDKCFRDVLTCECNKKTVMTEELNEEGGGGQIEVEEKLKKGEEEEDPEALFIKEKFDYVKKPPGLKEIIESQTARCADITHQQPFFDTAKDFLDGYKMKPIIPAKSLDYEGLDKVHAIAESLNRHSIQFLAGTMYKESIPTIRNEIKLPVFMRFYHGYETKYDKKGAGFLAGEGSDYVYMKKPPSLEQILKTNVAAKDVKTSSTGGVTGTKEKKPDFLKESLIDAQEKQRNIEMDKKLKQKCSVIDMAVLGFEVFARSRPNLLANPEIDGINVLVFNLSNERVKFSDQYNTKKITGVIIVDEIEYKNLKDIPEKIKIFYKLNEMSEVLVVKEEKDLINAFICLVFKFDPDIIYGYDLEKTSLYYLAMRAYTYGIDLTNFISRVPPNLEEIFKFMKFQNVQFDEATMTFLNDNSFFVTPDSSRDFESSTNEETKKQPVKKAKGFSSRWTMTSNFTMNFNIVGRVLINVWRIAQFELKLGNYDLENVIFTCFKKREPQFSNWTLTQWWDESREGKSRTIHYIFKKLMYTEEILSHLNTIPQTVEMTRLYGIDFDSVLTRGSQFKIEAVIIRVTKSNDTVLLSASKLQVAHQKMLQCTPRILEPPKQLFVDPVVVLDFQSLYPSVMIAYNLCWSTCLGFIDDLFIAGTKRLGVSEFTSPDIRALFGGKFEATDEEIAKKILITPNRVAFVRKEVRLGIIPRIIQEFLATRIMIKRSLKHYENMATIKKVLGTRQLAIKFFMNVMYGYTGASFSGRMPCSDIADSVVETAKTILSNSIKYIEEHKKWNAHVIYGDTDSMFVVLKGRTLDQAFDIGNEMAQEITKQHPYPIDLKFEKVYCPMLCLAKKRYTGWKYEKKGATPVLEGKGLESVRRDQVNAIVNMMQKSLIEIFQSRNVTQLKDYLYKQWSKILKGHINLKDFIFAKEVRLGQYVSIPPAALVSIENTKKDPMMAPKFQERVKYVVISGKQGSRVKDLVVSPDEYIKKHNYKINSKYYIENVINNALGRIFETFKVDVNDWYQNIPKGLNKVNLLVNEVHYMGSTTRENVMPKSLNFNLEKYYKFQVCILCYSQTDHTICDRCRGEPDTSQIISLQKIKFHGKEKNTLESVCRACSGYVMIGMQQVPCINIECPIYYNKIVAGDKISQLNAKLQSVIESLNR